MGCLRRKLALIILFTFSLLTPVSNTQAVDESELLLVVPAIIAANSRTNSKPGFSNTGPKGMLVPSGGLTIEADGTVVEGFDITGCIQVKANNVTIRNVRVNCSGFYAIQANFGNTGLLVENVELFNMSSSGILGSNFIVRRANIHDSGNDAIKAGSNVVIESSWFHKLGTKPNAHADGVQMVSGNNVIMRGNNFDMPHFLSGYRNSQCMIIQTNNGPIDNILIESNWLNGGGYCVQINDKGNGYGPPTNVVIRDNIFGPDCNFGILRFRNSSPSLSGNVYEANGLPIGSDFTICGNDLE